jgi:cytochrome P450
LEDFVSVQPPGTDYAADAWEVFAQFNRGVTFGPGSPYPTFKALRDQAPVHPAVPDLGITEQTPGQAPTFSVYGFDAATEVMLDTETYSNIAYHDMIGEVMGRTLIEMDPPEHLGYRMMLKPALSPKAMHGWKADLVEPLLAEMLDEIRYLGRVDLISTFLFTFPVRTFAAMLGLPRDEFALFHRYAIEVIASSANMDRALKASAALGAMFGEVLEDRRRNAQGDLISVLAEAQHDGQSLTDEEIFSFLRLLLPAGAETTYRSSSSLLFALLTQPEQMALVRDDISLLRPAMDEAFRWETPLLIATRRTTRDCVLAGVEIPAGSTVIINVGAANRDDSRWTDPDVFDLRRPRQNHVGFGHGAHLCLGMHLAKMETEALVRALLTELPGLRLDPDAPPPEIVGTLLRSPARLDVIWDV